MSSVILLLLILNLLPHICTSEETARHIKILNQSGRRISISWIHPSSGARTIQHSTPDVLNGASLALDSFVTHTFEILELPSKRTKMCIDGKEEEGACRKDYFTVNDRQNQVVFVREGVVVEHTDSYTIASERAEGLLERCKLDAREQMMLSLSSSGEDENCKEEQNKEEVVVEEQEQGYFSKLLLYWYGSNNNDDNKDASTTNSKNSEILEQLTNCVQSGIAAEIERANEEIAFQATIREDMADHWENYTCADDTLNTTEAKRTETWRGRKVSVMIDSPASKIHTVENFLTEDECKAVEEAAKPTLHDATVADGSGGSHKSDARKAKQAGITVHWDKEADGDLIARLSRRVYDYVNHVLPFNIMEDGQEDLMSIQYFGRGPEEDQPDRYMPHCDGDCNGMLFKPGNRMATIVMYCEIPKVGGATNFRNSGIHIKPKQYAATFFSYIDPETMKMDDEFTEHSGCPVVEGEKKIVTQWVRLGVDKENPWNSFNTLGIKHSDAENQ
eukprot:scaffold8508_cov161-Skeletonema_marinoi.AAC.4